MNKISLSAPWTYLTSTITIDYAPGVHEVEDCVYAKAVADGVAGGGTVKPANKGATDGGGTATESP